MKIKHYIFLGLVIAGCAQLNGAKSQAEEVAKRGQDSVKSAQDSIKKTQDAVDDIKSKADSAQKSIDQGRSMVASGMKSMQDFADRFRSDWDKLNRQLDGASLGSSKEELQGTLKKAKELQQKLAKEANSPEAKKQLAEIQAQINRLVATINLKPIQEKWTQMMKQLSVSPEKQTDFRLENKEFRKLDDQYHIAQTRYEKAQDKLAAIKAESKQ